MNKYDFIETVQKLRRVVEFNKFQEAVLAMEEFQAIVERVEENTLKWGDTSGINSKKKVDDSQKGLSEKELKWKEYFKNHSFQSLEELRNFSDAFSIVEGLDLNKYINTSRNKAKFPAYICIVPTCTSHNGHDYRTGQPIFSFGAGLQFYKLNGAGGNTMTTNIEEYRLGTRDEIVTVLLSILFRMGSAVEALSIGLIPD